MEVPRRELIHPIDLTIIIVFLAGFALFGLWQSRANKSSGDFFLGGRTLPWPAAMFSVVATETSVLTFISIPGIAYNGDWYFLQLALGYIMGRVLVSLFLLPRYLSDGVTSIYEVIGRRFGRPVQKTASAIFLVTRVLADGVRFLATAGIVQVITGWSLPTAVLIIGLVTVTYSLSGGIRSIIWIDSIQFFIYLLGAGISIIFLFSELAPSPQGSLMVLLFSGKLNIFHCQGSWLADATHVLPAMLGGACLSLASHGVDHMMVQRVLTCKDLSAARKAMIGSGIFVFVQFAVFLVVGSLIYLIYDAAPMEKDREFATYIKDHLPRGIRGFLLAGVLSAAMSTLSSSINALASSTITDWFKQKTASLGMSRLVSFAWAAVLIGIALVLKEDDNPIVVLGFKVVSFTYGPLLGLFILSKTRSAFPTPSLVAGLLLAPAAVLGLLYLDVAWPWFVLAGTLVMVMVVLPFKREIEQ